MLLRFAKLMDMPTLPHPHVGVGKSERPHPHVGVGKSVRRPAGVGGGGMMLPMSLHCIPHLSCGRYCIASLICPSRIHHACLLVTYTCARSLCLMMEPIPVFVALVPLRLHTRIGCIWVHFFGRIIAHPAADRERARVRVLSMLAHRWELLNFGCVAMDRFQTICTFPSHGACT